MQKDDKGEPLGEQTKNIRFEDPEDMIQFLTKANLESLNADFVPAYSQGPQRA